MERPDDLSRGGKPKVLGFSFASACELQQTQGVITSGHPCIEILHTCCLNFMGKRAERCRVEHREFVNSPESRSLKKEQMDFKNMAH